MKTLWKESILSIIKNFKRFLSILLITLLGVGFFAGIRVTSPNMKKTLDEYYKKYEFMDLNIISTWGLREKDIDQLSDNDLLEPSYEIDAIVRGDEEEVIKILSYNSSSKINQPILLEGRMPKENHECVIEQNQYTKSHQIGDQITVENDSLKEQKLTVVGIIKSPIYISLERGTTTLLSGKIKYYMYVSEENFNLDYYTNVYVKIKNDYDTFSTEYKELLENKITEYQTTTTKIGEQRYEEELNQAREEINKQRKKLEEEKKSYSQKIEASTKQLEEGDRKYRQNLENLNNQMRLASSEITAAKKLLTSSNLELAEQKKQLELKKSEWDTKLGELQILQNNLISQKEELEKSTEEIAINYKDLLATKEVLEQLLLEEVEVEKNTELLKEVEENLISLSAKEIEIGESLTKIEGELSTLDLTITQTTISLEEASTKLQEAEKELQVKNRELSEKEQSMQSQFKTAQKQLQSAAITLQNSAWELEKGKKQAESEFKLAEEAIIDAEDQIEQLEEPTWYVLDRDSNLGFYQYSQDTERIKNIGKLFPLVFFLVAVLVCLTSMTRMVEEERSELGTLKALGYTNLQIVSKYILYALLATLIGSVVGVAIGFEVLPKIIFNMYSMMYNIGDIVIEFNLTHATGGMLVAIFCTLTATLFACYRELREVPSSLMRPKAPQAGKRVLLERITSFWNRLSFTRKVTIRNVFRYKKRFLMTILGIAGCTGLMIAGFGLRDCITGMVPSQYEKVFNYQVELTLKESLSIEEVREEVERIRNLEGVDQILVLNKESVEIQNKKTNQSIQLITPETDMKGFINLQNRTTKKEYQLKDEVIITEKIAKLLDLHVGDEISLKTDQIYKVKIGAITENYFYHYIYMSPEQYQKSSYNTIFLKTGELSEKQENQLSTVIKQTDKVATISFTSAMRGVFDSSMQNFSYVVIVLIVSAGMLAFVVLYNLASVNISERKRELATIKVLGFYDHEVYNYIGRETTILTIIGMIIGMGIGKVLTIFILRTCELDPIMFDTTISFNSYLYSLLLTITFTILVNITTYFALKKVNMIESLKSIE